MKPSPYPKAFEKLAECREAFELIGDCILVEEIEDDEFRTQGGLIIASGTKQINGVEADKPTFARVLWVGEGYYDDDSGKSIPLNVEPGDVILVGRHSIKRFSVFGSILYSGTRIGLTRESEIQLRFKGEAGYDRFFGTLNSAIKAQMEQG